MPKKDEWNQLKEHTCNKCELTQDITQFYAGPIYSHTCKSCRDKRARENRFMNKYGITVDDYNDMSKAQDGVCFICHEPPAKLLVVDHCHTTNKVRGLLCNSCNAGLGFLKDSTRILENALRYIREHCSHD